MSRAGKIKKTLSYMFIVGAVVGLIYLNDRYEREKRERKRLEELVQKTAMSDVYRELGVEYNPDNPRKLSKEEMERYLKNHKIEYSLD